MDAPRHTVPRSHRLGGRAAFRAVFDAGVRASRGPLTAYVRSNDLAHPRLGLSVGRRVGNAVVRNRTKRLLREAFRHIQHEIPADFDFVVVVRPHESMALPEYQRLLAEVFERACRQWRRRPVSGSHVPRSSP